MAGRIEICRFTSYVQRERAPRPGDLLVELIARGLHARHPRALAVTVFDQIMTAYGGRRGPRRSHVNYISVSSTTDGHLILMRVCGTSHQHLLTVDLADPRALKAVADRVARLEGIQMGERSWSCPHPRAAEWLAILEGRPGR